MRKKPLRSAVFFVWQRCEIMESMQEATIQVNPDASLDVFAVGEERTLVVVIDDFALDTAEIIAHARNEAEFNDDQRSAYPGIRAPMTRSHVGAQLDAIYPLLRKVYSVPEDMAMRPINTSLSLIATPENKLKLHQRVPHFDSNRPYYFALTHYLNDGDFGGTGLYRHRPTGFENLVGARLDQYIEARDAFLAEHGEPPQRYFGASDAHYELYDRIEYKPNRLIAYPGYLLHSGLVEPERDINPDPRTGRLTSNVFVDFQ
jgi:hypothetical protein